MFRGGFGLTDTNGLIASYSEYLKAKHPAIHEQFERRGATDREAALAEAVVFRMLTTLQVRPEVNEDPKLGGADFICTRWRGPLFKPSPQDRFVVEATSLNVSAVSTRSNLPNEIPDDISGGAYALVTPNIFNKVKDKATQLANYPMPSILAIVSGHNQVAALFNAGTATWALTSEIHWRHDIGSNVVDPNEYTDLKNAIFMRPQPDGTVEAVRKSISAILLVGVYGDKSEVWGILHPDPAYPLNVELLSKVPFVRVAHWPIVDGHISTEWVIGNPKGFESAHMLIHWKE